VTEGGIQPFRLIEYLGYGVLITINQKGTKFGFFIGIM